MNKKQKKPLKVEYIESSASDQEKQERLDKAFDILFTEAFKTFKKSCKKKIDFIVKNP